MSSSIVSERLEGVWRVHSREPGPHLGFVGGVHGNELAGIVLVKRLVKAFKTGELMLTRGTLTLALGNLEAIALNQRATAPNRDLNRCFGPGVMQPCETHPEALRAAALARLLQSVDIGIDLHATNLPSTPFLVVQSLHGARTEAVLSHLHAEILLTDPHWIFGGGPTTLDEFFNRGRRIGVCYETGFARDLSRLEEIEAELLDLLRHFKLISGAPHLGNQAAPARYELVQALVPAHDGFVFAHEAELRNFFPVAAGSVVGYDGSGPIVSAHEGVLVFPKATHLRLPGKPVGYLARRH